MLFKVGIFALTVLVGTLASPAEDDMSIYFDHTEPEPFIVGGTTAGVVPWMVALTRGHILKSFMCGGSIITNRHILTAAHCLDRIYSRGSLISSFRATVGTNRWNRGGTTYSVERNITHPHYVNDQIKNDITFLITTADIIFINNVAPVTLNFDYVGTGVHARVNGWGSTRTGGSASSNLMELAVSTVDNDFCISEVARVAIEIRRVPPPVEPHIELCTFNAINRGLCNGDSGSALVREDNNQQIGIVSWGMPCARGAPDMFVRISAFRTWIESIIG